MQALKALNFAGVDLIIAGFEQRPLFRNRSMQKEDWGQRPFKLQDLPHMRPKRRGYAYIWSTPGCHAVVVASAKGAKKVVELGNFCLDKQADPVDAISLLQDDRDLQVVACVPPLIGKVGVVGGCSFLFFCSGVFVVRSQANCSSRTRPTCTKSRWRGTWAATCSAPVALPATAIEKRRGRQTSCRP